MEPFFSPNSSGDLRSDAHQSQIVGGDADVDHTQIIGGNTSPPGFGTPSPKKGHAFRFHVLGSSEFFGTKLAVFFF